MLSTNYITATIFHVYLLYANSNFYSREKNCSRLFSFHTWIHIVSLKKCFQQYLYKFLYPLHSVILINFSIFHNLSSITDFSRHAPFCVEPSSSNTAILSVSFLPSLFNFAYNSYCSLIILFIKCLKHFFWRTCSFLFKWSQLILFRDFYAEFNAQNYI